MTFTAIDGDISDFFDAQTMLTTEVFTKEIQSYLVKAGHSEQEAAAAVAQWMQKGLTEAVPGQLTLRLTETGIAAVEKLRARS
jgi:hypothetical protein